MLKQLLLVGLGGGAGSILRYLLSLLTEKYYNGHFPLATFLINVSGCLLIGVLIGLFGPVNGINQNTRLLFITGFCGGYTTFSTFAAENIRLLQSGNITVALLYILTSVLSGLLFVRIGLSLATLINSQ